MKRRTIISALTLAITMLMVFSAVTVIGAPPQPFVRQGTAKDGTGSALPNGDTVSAWADGVEYATNVTYYSDGSYKLTVPGNDSATEKDGAANNELLIYWMYDGSNWYIANEVDNWVTQGDVLGNLTFASSGQPYMAKLWELVPQPASGNDFLWIAAPSNWDPTDYSLANDDGWSMTLTTSNTLYKQNQAGTWSAWYVDLGGDVLANADEMKLVWTDPNGVIAGGNAVPIDRVEYGGQTVSPDNTIMPDAAAPGSDQGIIRKNSSANDPLTAQDTENCTADFYVKAADYPVMWEPTATPNLWVEKNGNDAILHWDAAVDGNGNSPPGGYNIYESNSSLAAWPWQTIATGVSGLSYTDTGAVSDSDNHFYIVRATDGSTEGGNSSMAFVAKFNVVKASAGTTNWVSIPDEVFAMARDITGDGTLTASDIVTDIEGGTGSGTNTKISQIAVWDASGQTIGAQYYYSGGFDNEWIGKDFTITPGMAVQMEASSSFTWAINGTDNGTAGYSIVKATSGTTNWVSVPFTLKDMNGDGVITASDIVIQIEGGTGSGTNTKISQIAVWDASGQTIGAQYYYSGGFDNEWIGKDFTITPGMAVQMEASSSFTWTPEIVQTVVTQ